MVPADVWRRFGGGDRDDFLQLVVPVAALSGRSHGGGQVGADRTQDLVAQSGQAARRRAGRSGRGRRRRFGNGDRLRTGSRRDAGVRRNIGRGLQLHGLNIVARRSDVGGRTGCPDRGRSIERRIGGRCVHVGKGRIGARPFLWCLQVGNDAGRGGKPRLNQKTIGRRSRRIGGRGRCHGRRSRCRQPASNE